MSDLDLEMACLWGCHGQCVFIQCKCRCHYVVPVMRAPLQDFEINLASLRGPRHEPWIFWPDILNVSISLGRVPQVELEGNGLTFEQFEPCIELSRHVDYMNGYLAAVHIRTNYLQVKGYIDFHFLACQGVQIDASIDPNNPRVHYFKMRFNAVYHDIDTHNYNSLKGINCQASGAPPEYINVGNKADPWTHLDESSKEPRAL